MKNFSIPVFLISTIIVGLLLFLSFIAAFSKDEGTLKPDDLFWNFFAHLFSVMRFPTHTLFWPIIISGGPLTYFGGLFINCLFYGLVIERVISLFKKGK